MAAPPAVAALRSICDGSASPGGGVLGLFVFTGGPAMLVVCKLVFGFAAKDPEQTSMLSTDNFTLDDTPPASGGETGFLLRPEEE